MQVDLLVRNGGVLVDHKWLLQPNHLSCPMTNKSTSISNSCSHVRLKCLAPKPICIVSHAGEFDDSVETASRDVLKIGIIGFGNPGQFIARGKNGWRGMPFVFDRVRINEKNGQAEKCDQFLRIFEQEGCQVVKMSCEEHDRQAVGSQLITHTIGRNVEGLCEEQPDVVLVCSSILSIETVLRSIPMHLLKQDTVFADVLSVKQFPRNLFLEILLAGFGCTHPMFGPESGKDG